MIRIIFILFFLSLSGFIFAQAELQKVREMYSPVNEAMEVGIWKGHFHANHPVEMFLASQDNEVKGYYRLISSGEEFTLEGEKDKNGITLTEYLGPLAIGTLYATAIPSKESQEKLVFQWQNMDRFDVINIELQAAKFSDYTKNSFRPEARKYCEYENGTETCILIELLDDERLIYTESNSNESIALNRDPNVKDLSFTIVDDNNEITYSEVNKTLRKQQDGQFSYFKLQNSLQYKRINYASSELIMDIEYPELDHEEFNAFMDGIITSRRKKIRREIKEQELPSETHPADLHYQHKWEAWTEMDYLGNSFISGRMILLKSLNGNTSMEVIPFNYDLIENEDIKIQKEFKNDFNFDSYLEKLVHAEIPTFRSNKSANPELQYSDFKYLTISDNDIVISTDYDWNYGESFILIPHDEVRGLVKRNSILKTLMKR